MDSITLFVLALGLSMDAFAVSISNSMCFSGLRRNEAALTSLSFGVFQGLMPVAGYFAGRAFADVVSAFDHWIAFALLGFIGGKMIWDAVKELRAPEACPVGRAFSYKLMVVQAFATSIDALAVGVSFAALDVNIAAAASFIACVTFVCWAICWAKNSAAGWAVRPRYSAASFWCASAQRSSLSIFPAAEGRKKQRKCKNVRVFR